MVQFVFDVNKVAEWITSMSMEFSVPVTLDLEDFQKLVCGEVVYKSTGRLTRIRISLDDRIGFDSMTQAIVKAFEEARKEKLGN